MGLEKGDEILDAGCGPGLYCERFASAGCHVTGIDISDNSIRINGSYLDMSYNNALKPGGYFVFDVSTPVCEANAGEQCNWYACDHGFWSSEQNLVLEKNFITLKKQHICINTLLQPMPIQRFIDCTIYTIQKSQ